MLAPSQTHTDRYGVIAGLRWDINDRPHGPRQLHLRSMRTTARPAKSACSRPMASRSTSSRSTIRIADVTGRRPAEARPPVLRDPEPVSRRISRRFRPADGQCRRSARRSSSATWTTIASRRGAAASSSAWSDRRTMRIARQPLCRQPDHRRYPGLRRRSARFKYDKLLPNVGFDLRLHAAAQRLRQLSKGLSVPSTDNLYNGFFFPTDTDAGEAEAGDDRQLRRRRPLPQLARSRRSCGLVHPVQRSPGLGLRSGAEPVGVPQPRHGRTSGASTARSPTSRSGS